MQVIRDLELLPELLGQNWSSVFLQKFEGELLAALTTMQHPDDILRPLQALSLSGLSLAFEIGSTC